MLFHVLHRAVAREKIFWKPDDYPAFEAVLQEAGARVPMRLLSSCIRPNHWHRVLWPRGDDDLSEYLRWLTVTHAKRWHSNYHSSGSGALERAEEWRWWSLWHRVQGSSVASLAAWPVPAGRAWGSHVNRVETEAELKAVRRSVVRSLFRPVFGDVPGVRNVR